MKQKFLWVATVYLILATSCKPVKEYQKMYLNDADMELSMRRGQKFENSFELYREGSAGANGGKPGGGCGCN
jgi:hypothetical protein